MEYLDIAHETYPVWVWTFDSNLKYHKTRNGHQTDISAGVASGRVDSRKEIGSICFTPFLERRVKKHVIAALLNKFTGVKFYVFEQEGMSLSEYYEQL